MGMARDGSAARFNDSDLHSQQCVQQRTHSNGQKTHSGWERSVWLSLQKCLQTSVHRQGSCETRIKEPVHLSSGQLGSTVILTTLHRTSGPWTQSRPAIRFPYFYISLHFLLHWASSWQKNFRIVLGSIKHFLILSFLILSLLLTYLISYLLLSYMYIEISRREIKKEKLGSCKDHNRAQLT